MAVVRGWFAYVLMDNSLLSFLFAGLLTFLILVLWRMQRQPDSFDLRDLICEWNAEHTLQIVSTNKTLLTGAFLTSSYYVIRNSSDAAFFAYLTAWVVNGGITAWQKTQAAKVEAQNGS